jgi:hypothetical protein
MGTRYLVDTNTVSDYLSRNLSPEAMQYLHGIVNSTPQISVMTRIEILSFLSPKIDIIRNFVGYATVFSI